MHFKHLQNVSETWPKVAHTKICPNMPKWNGDDLGQEHPQKIKTINKVHTSQISRLIKIPCSPAGLLAWFGGHIGGQLEFWKCQAG